MSIEHLLPDLALDVEPFAMCVVSSGWRLRVPQADSATLHFVLEGTGQLRLPAEANRRLSTYSLAVVPDQRGHALQVPPTPLREAIAGATRHDRVAEHIAGVDGDRELLVACGRVRVRYGGATPLFALLDHPLVVDFADSPAIRVLFGELLGESGQARLGRVSMLRALMTQCLVALLRRLHDERQGDMQWLDAVAEPRIARVVAAVLDDPGAPHTVDSLARVAHMSRSAFAAQFRDVLGRPPMDFVRQVRLQRAAELLRTTDLDTATIARRIGYSSRSHFSRTFQSAFGASPMDHRHSGSRHDESG